MADMDSRNRKEKRKKNNSLKRRKDKALSEKHAIIRMMRNNAIRLNNGDKRIKPSLIKKGMFQI